MGALMGGGVGLTIGFIFGSWSIIRLVCVFSIMNTLSDSYCRGGAGPRGALSTLSQYMLSSAATFSFFLSIGSVIRSDSIITPQLQAAQQLAPAFSMQSRAEGAKLMRARWEAERSRVSLSKN
ncbi:hypothetical protein D9613_002025 [Agrocybe pediades]|uniref:Uncharacterized protein n=1 Tax=Agrocybe pediades TaxID=84607 RepID=A0A8H4VVR0_9AGAR|nr:hypothetical protein D9613_002025 [Agrocybe pediades]